MTATLKKPAWLVAEYNGHDIYMGWHLYLRDSSKHQPNQNGEWGWIRHPAQDKELSKLLRRLGCPITGDGTGSDDGIAIFAAKFPLRGKKIWGEKRGGVKVNLVGEWDRIELAKSSGQKIH